MYLNYIFSVNWRKKTRPGCIGSFYSGGSCASPVWQKTLCRALLPGWGNIVKQNARSLIFCLIVLFITTLPPPHYYDNHLDFSPPPSPKIKSPFFALPCSLLQSCLGDLDRLQLASAVVVLLVARHRQVARLDIVGTYKMSSSKKWESQYSQRLFGAKVRVLIRRRLCKNKQYTISTILCHWYGLV